jgi:guanylate kinase
MGKLIILSGPSCVGKSPLDKALGRFYPKIRSQLQHLVLYNSRAPRPGELDGRDYHFRSRQEIKKLGEKDHIVSMEVRGDLQALDIKELKQQLKEGDLFFEGNPFVGRTLQTNPALEDIVKISVFMSPLSKEEIAFLSSDESNADPEKIVTDIMRRKLLRRTRKQKGEMSLKDLENIERRASSAYTELKDAHFFDFVIPNHDGEDSENWDAFYYPVGDARKSLLSFVNIMEGLPCDYCEHWEEDLVS